MATRISIVVDPETKEEIETREEVPDEPKAPVSSSAPSNPLASWLLNEEDETPTCEEFQIEGAPSSFFVRRLDLEGLTRVGLYSSRNLKGELILVAEGHFRGLLAAVMFVALAKDATGSESLFSDWPTAYKVAHSTKKRTVNANTVLFAKILEVNPSILPKVREEQEAEGSADFLSGKAPVTLK